MPFTINQMKVERNGVVVGAVRRQTSEAMFVVFFDGDKERVYEFKSVSVTLLLQSINRDERRIDQHYTLRDRA